MVLSEEPGEIDKKMWYDGIRNRFSTALLDFSDEQLEQGIEELEEQFKDQDVVMTGIACLTV